ncbi:alkaline phosphatase [Algicola sagamiensis]|uniref:alkaline phosphatase n=1 Tax=Algicola sagamiensis TaxID=163869 RepID=UPI00036F2040|nr:alkaline phosphatase [Algicola sagamiensis]
MRQHALAIALGITFISGHLCAAHLPDHQQSDTWYQNAQAALAEKLKVSTTPGKAKNVILFVGDGMGISTITAMRIYAGQQQPNHQGGEEYQLSFEKFPHSALVKTYNTNQQTPDSAGTMTAMVTGVKTKAGMISVNANSERANCLTSKRKHLTTALELAEMKGLSTGIVTTARLTHATPAAAYAHSPERNWESDADLPEEASKNGCKDIAAQLLDFSYGDGIDVALGGGRRSFLPKDVQDSEGKNGKRKDGRDLTKEWQAKGTYVWNQATFDQVESSKTNKLLGLFASSHMQYEADRANDKGSEPSLAEMTKKAIEILEKNDKGYVLIIESGRIDHGHHDGNTYRALTDGVAFHQAVKTAIQSTDAKDTLLIVTADHSHVFTLAGYPRRGNPILGHVEDQDGNKKLAKDDLPYTTAGYMNGPGALHRDNNANGRRDLMDINTQAKDYKQEALIPMDYETHAAEDVAVHASGPGAHLFQGVIEQNVIFHVINEAAQLGGETY